MKNNELRRSIGFCKQFGPLVPWPTSDSDHTVQHRNFSRPAPRSINNTSNKSLAAAVAITAAATAQENKHKNRRFISDELFEYPSALILPWQNNSYKPWEELNTNSSRITARFPTFNGDFNNGGSFEIACGHRKSGETTRKIHSGLWLLTTEKVARILNMIGISEA